MIGSVHYNPCSFIGIVYYKKKENLEKPVLVLFQTKEPKVGQPEFINSSLLAAY